MRTIGFLLLITLFAGVNSAAAADYVGVKNCKMCHNKTEKGAQFTIWENGPHAHSFETLLSPEAIAVAKERGLPKPPSESAECLGCHVTGFGEATGFSLDVDPADSRAVRKNEALQAVTCESCHGAGGDYKSKATMEGIHSGTIEAASVGLVIPNEKTCTKCHNEKSPSFKGFNFEEQAAKIAHPYPG
jgi:hypothetical protein